MTRRLQSGNRELLVYVDLGVKDVIVELAGSQ
jgi:hypothetical protein